MRFSTPRISSSISDETIEVRDFGNTYESANVEVHLTRKSKIEATKRLCTVSRSKKNGKLVVLKTTRPPSPPSPSDQQPTEDSTPPLPNELRILRIVKLYSLKIHPNIVRLLSNSYWTPNIVQLEFCSGGDLGAQLRHSQAQDGVLSTPPIFTLHVLISLARALTYLHHGTDYRYGIPREGWDPIVHGDIRPEHVLLRWPGKSGKKYGMPDVVLAGFGGARLASKSHETSESAPPLQNNITVVVDDERKANEEDIIPTTKTDIYDLGLLLHLMATGTPFPPSTDPSTISLPPSHHNIAGILPFIVWCLQPSPADRPEFTDSEDNGLFHARHMFEIRRKFLIKRDGKLDMGVWNISELRDESRMRRLAMRFGATRAV